MQQGSSSGGSVPNNPPPVFNQPAKPYVPPVTAPAQVHTTTTTSSVEATINVPPATMATAVFILREIIALLFVFAWLAMLSYDLFFATETEVVPFWLNMIGVGVLAYALGINVEHLTAFRGVTIART